MISLFFNESYGVAAFRRWELNRDSKNIMFVWYGS